MGTKMVIIGAVVWAGVIAHYGFPADPVVWFTRNLSFFGKAVLVIATVVIVFGLFVYED